MLKFALAIFVALPVSAFASMSVDITSFLYTGTRTQSAELCGLVKGHTGMVVVHVTVDETSKSPGHYRTLAEQDGQFCVVVSTNNGTAIAEVKQASLAARATQATATSGERDVLPRAPRRKWRCSARPSDSFYPTYYGDPDTNRWYAENSAIRRCEFSTRRRCVQSSCYQQ